MGFAVLACIGFTIELRHQSSLTKKLYDSNKPLKQAEEANTVEFVRLIDNKEFVAELAALHHVQWSHLNPSLTQQKRAEAIAKAAGRQGIPSMFIAKSGSQLIGSAALVQQDMDIKLDLSPWLAAVYVKEGFRQQGIATELIAQCESEAVRSKVKIWYLYTESAAKLYENLGWRHMERCKYKGEMVDVMCKQIAP